MVFRQILISSYIGFSLFIVLTIVFGSGGLFDTRDISRYKLQLEENITELREINQGLTQELKALSTSPDTIKMYARDYGYYETNEEVIKIAGAPQPRRYYRLGSLLRRNIAVGEQNPVFHIIGFAAALVSFGAGLVIARRSQAAA